MPKTANIKSTANADDQQSSAPATEDRVALAEKIVRKSVYCAVGLGAFPIPIVDLAGVGGVQLHMISELSKLYGVSFSEKRARNISSALIGSLGARALSLGVTGSLVKSLPFVGAFIGGVIAMPAIAGGTTHALGRVFINHFQDGGTLLDLDVGSVKDRFASQFRSAQKTGVTGPDDSKYP